MTAHPSDAEPDADPAPVPTPPSTAAAAEPAPVPVVELEPLRLPTPLRVTADVCWRLLVIVAALALLIFLIATLRVVVIPVAIAVLLAALGSPVVAWLAAHKVPRGIATVLVLIAGFALLGGLLTFVVNTFINGRTSPSRSTRRSPRTEQRSPPARSPRR